jgi:myo-inositol-1(or 4)-monophosphatase
MTHELEAAINAVTIAGRILRAGFGQAHDIQLKGPSHLVTETDRAVEAKIIELLQSATPDYGLVTEESGSIERQGDSRWIIDPIDGTTNYAHGCPRFCISVALERAHELELGVIHDPLQNELFIARRGMGTTLNGRAIHVSTTDVLQHAVLSTGFPYDAWTNDRDNSVEVAYFVKRVLTLRSTGSVALDLADVACGRRDAHWERGLSAHDIAAGVLLVREAGGVVTDYIGRPDVLDEKEIVASNPVLHREIIAYLKTRH